MTKWTGEEDQVKEVEQMFRRGETVRAIARNYSCRTQLVSDALRGHGYTVARGCCRVPVERQEAVLTRYADGATIRAIAREFDLGEAATSGILRRAGVRNGKGSRWDEGRLAALRVMYSAGFSKVEIGRQLGLTPSATLRALRMAGIPPEPARSGASHPNWKGGRVLAGGGYIAVKLTAADFAYCHPNTSGYALEHRLVMSRKLGRQLRPSETVHHINGDRADNRPENLQVRQGTHGSGVVAVCLDCGSHNVGTEGLV